VDPAERSGVTTGSHSQGSWVLRSGVLIAIAGYAAFLFFAGSGLAIAYGSAAVLAAWLVSVRVPWVRWISLIPTVAAFVMIYVMRFREDDVVIPHDYYYWEWLVGELICLLLPILAVASLLLTAAMALVTAARENRTRRFASLWLFIAGVVLAQALWAPVCDLGAFRVADEHFSPPRMYGGPPPTLVRIGQASLLALAALCLIPAIVSYRTARRDR
jgi:hypothetical protein